MTTYLRPLPLSGLIIIALSSTILAESTPLQDLKKSVTKLLFGEVWNYGEYCGDLKSSEGWIREDEEAAKFYETSDSLRYINESLDMEQLLYRGIRARYYTTLTCAINSWGYKDDETFKLSDSPSNDRLDCLNSLDRLHKMAVNNVTFDGVLIHQLNSFGRVPQGPIHHSHQWIGDYAECIQDTGSRYCFASYQMEHWQSYNPQIPQMFIRIGMCISKTCNQQILTSDDSALKIDEIIAGNLLAGRGVINLTNFRRANIADQIYCPPSLDSEYMNLFADKGSVLLGLLSAAWIATIVYATILGGIIDLGYFRAFDLKVACSKLVQVDRSDASLSGLNFFKVACFFWILWSHYIMLATSYVFNIHDLRRIWNPSFFGTFIFQAQHAVSMFFIVTGLLVGFKYIANDNKSIKYPDFVWQRYLRLAPLYLIVYTYVRKFAHLLNSGPLWDYGVSVQSEANQCHQESWLVPLLMLSNFLHPFSHCILTGWHIANDFQAFLILPLFIWVYRKCRRLGTWIMIASFFMSHLFHFFNFHTAVNYSFDLLVKEPYLFGSRYMMDRLAIDYVNPLGRIGTITIGLLLAKLLKSRSFCDKYASRKCRAIFLIVGLVLEGMSLMARFEMALGRLLFGPYIRSVAYPFTRLTVELGWFLILLGTLLANHQTSGTPIAPSLNVNGKPHKELDSSVAQFTFMAHHGIDAVGFHKWHMWDILVKLNYSLMLIHFPVFRHLVQSIQTQPVHFSLLALLQHGSFVIMMSYLASLLLHILVEVPLSSVIKRLTME